VACRLRVVVCVAETIVLDPAAVATSRTSVDITAFVSSEGIDWGDAAITAYQAEGERGSLPVDFTYPNRIVVIPLKLQTRGATSFNTIRRNLQAKVGQFQQEGGWMSRTTSVGTVYGDVVSATLRLGGDWYQANKDYDANAILTLEVVPDWYGAEVSLDDKTETTLPTYVKVMQLSAADAVIAGDYPGRVRIVVDDDQARARRGLLWGWRSRYYSSASTAALFYQAEALTALDLSVSGTALTGASSTTMFHTSVATDWTPILSTLIAGVGQMTHIGTYRVWVRFFSNNSGGDIDLRFVWDVGDLSNPTYNAPFSTYAAMNSGDLLLADLGEIRIDQVPVGTHVWQGQIQAKGDLAGADLYIDTLEFQPIDDGAGVITTSVTADPGLVGYTARDGFNQTAGALVGKTADVGGTWSGAGDTDDFQVDATADTTYRTNVSDTEARLNRLGTSTPAAVAVQADMAWGLGSPSLRTGVFARYSSTTSHVIACINHSAGATPAFLEVTRQSSAGIYTSFATVEVDEISAAPSPGQYTIRLAIDTSGNYWVWLWQTGGSPGDPLITGSASSLATGGLYDDGGVGIFDHHSSAIAITRTYDNFLAWVPDLDAVIHPSQSIELRTEGFYRENAAGTASGPVIPKSGGLPRIPVSGLESRKVELYLRASRGDLAGLPDNGIDDISARVHYRPSWLIAPGS
jgi:hypothetical protein